ncbi:transcriptional repressor LexA [Oceanicaulis sp. AH-315-P02]|nr:transcriptional repressor LexA [Robiginitomaculum sp.]MBN4047755.1 transcriptional repressor LexA [Oceanicaulis sp. AH-315-P02]
MLTKKQHALLVFINQRLTDSGVSPSFDEMKDALGLASKSGIHRLITALEERGFIKRLAHRARALEVIKLPESSVPEKSIGGFKPNIVSNNSDPVASNSNNIVEIPVLGRIAAGTPIEAIQHETSKFPVPAAMVGHGEHYALTISGDSMIDAGIHDGDTVIIRKTQTAQNGDIVVALVDDQEATLKRFHKKGNSIALEAANPDYETRIFGPDRVVVQGTLIGLMRSYN